MMAANTNTKPKKEGQETWFEWIKTMVIALAFAILIRTFFYAPFTIPSGSMIPTMLVGDYIFVSKFAYGFSKYSLPFHLPLFEGRIFASTPKRGDVVVFYSHADGKDWIKRLIGLPGDKIQMVKGAVHLNGKPLDLKKIEDFKAPDGFYEMTDYGAIIKDKPIQGPHYIETFPEGRSHPIIKLKDFGDGSLDDSPEYTVPQGHYFVMGDNRDQSGDSRIMERLGFLQDVELIGRADFLFFSSNGTARMWEIWKWPFSVRYSRLLQIIR